MVDMSSHHYDLLNWYVGSKPTKVGAFGGTEIVRVVKSDNEVIDHASVSFEYEKRRHAADVVCSMFEPTRRRSTSNSASPTMAGSFKLRCDW